MASSHATARFKQATGLWQEPDTPFRKGPNVTGLGTAVYYGNIYAAPVFIPETWRGR